MSLLNRLFAPPPPKKTPIEKLRALVDADQHMDAIIFAKEAHLGHDLAFMLIERMEGLPPAERVPLRAVIAAAFWDDERQMTPSQAITAAHFYLDRDDVPGIESALRHILRFDDTHAEALYFRAIAHIRRNHFRDALTIMGKILELDPDNAAVKRTVAIFAKLLKYRPPALVGESRPLLVCIGGGVDQVIRMTPVLRAIAEGLGHPVDVTVTQEVGDDRLTLVSRSGVTDRVGWFGKPTFQQRYERVLVTESFGEAFPLFSADHVLSAHAWDAFRPGGDRDEIRHAIDVAADLLGFARPTAVPDPYVGDLPVEQAHVGSGEIALLPHGLGGTAVAGAWSDWAPLATALGERKLAPVVLGIKEAASVGGADPRTFDTLISLAAALRDVAAVVATSSEAATLAHAVGVPVVAIGTVPIASLRSDAAVEVVAGPDTSADTVAEAVRRIAR